jgi:hypothetical protein
MAAVLTVIGTPLGGIVIAAGTFTADVIAGTPGTTQGTGSPANLGTGSWAGASKAWAEGSPVTFHNGDMLYLDSSGPASPPTGPQALYIALNAAGATFRAATANDSVGHAALGN